MGTKEKLFERLKGMPTDFTFAEAERLLTSFGYTKSNKGRTSESRVLFSKSGKLPVFMHRPHPNKELKQYAIKQLISELIRNGEFEL